jgi:hypothetical protein
VGDPEGSRNRRQPPGLTSEQRQQVGAVHALHNQPRTAVELAATEDRRNRDSRLPRRLERELLAVDAGCVRRVSHEAQDLTIAPREGLSLTALAQPLKAIQGGRPTHGLAGAAVGS